MRIGPSCPSILTPPSIPTHGSLPLGYPAHQEHPPSLPLCFSGVGNCCNHGKSGCFSRSSPSPNPHLTTRSFAPHSLPIPHPHFAMVPDFVSSLADTIAGLPTHSMKQDPFQLALVDWLVSWFRFRFPVCFPWFYSYMAPRGQYFLTTW